MLLESDISLVDDYLAVRKLRLLRWLRALAFLGGRCVYFIVVEASALLGRVGEMKLRAALELLSNSRDE